MNIHQSGKATAPTARMLVGAKSLAKFLNVSERQVYYWNSLNPKPFRFFNIRDKLAGRKSTLAEDLMRLEAGKAA